MKILTVVGARPQFIKAAAFSRALRKAERGHEEVMVHTGQHFDDNMSQVFFDEMGIPAPAYNLGIHGGTHGQMTGRMLEAVEGVLLAERPDVLLVYGDTNSTMAAALAAAKLHVPIAHVEAGGRMGTLSNPEEVNRIVSDHVATLLFAPTQTAMDNLKKEGLAEKSYLVGNIMYDSYLEFAYGSSAKDAAKIVELLSGELQAAPDCYYLLTCHREENTHDDEVLSGIFRAMSQLDAPTVYPVHPRNRERAQRLVASGRFDGIVLCEPVGYADSVALIRGATRVVTDSGGLQCEAFYAQVPCVFVFGHVAWPETMVGNRNQIARPDEDDLLAKLGVEQSVDPGYCPFGDGHAAEKILSALESNIN